MSHEITAREDRRAFERYTPAKQAFIIDHKGFGIIKNISLGGIAMCCVKGSTIGQGGPFDIFVARSSFSLLPEEYGIVVKRPTQGQAMIINHISFKNLSPVRIDSLWDKIRSNLCPHDRHMAEVACQDSVSFKRQGFASNLKAIYANPAILPSQNCDKNLLLASSIPL